MAAVNNRDSRVVTSKLACEQASWACSDGGRGT